MPISPQLYGNVDRASYPLERVVSVDKEDAVVRQGSCVSLKRLGFAFEKHDPAVGLRAAHRNVVALAGEQIRRAHAAADISGSACA